MAGLGAALTAIAILWPPPATRRIQRPSTLIDWYVPEFQFSEKHEKLVHARPERIFAAIRSVTADDIALFRTLTAIRNPRRIFGRQPESLLNPSEKPILDLALRSGFQLLGEEPGHELVVGVSVVEAPGRPRLSPQGFAALAAPDAVKAAMNFRVEPMSGGAFLLTTETRVFATDRRAAGRFAAYWRIIYPGSSLLRRTWLAAIARRAESS